MNGAAHLQAGAQRREGDGRHFRHGLAAKVMMVTSDEAGSNTRYPHGCRPPAKPT